MRKFVCAMLLGSCFAFSSVSAAESPKVSQQAVEAFQQGVDFFTAGAYQKASEAFRHANELQYNWKILYNIGQSEASAKRYGLALEAFEAYLVQGGDEIDIARRDEVLEEVQRMKLMVASVEVEGPPGATVFIDDFPRGTLPLPGPLMIAAGIEHPLRVEQDGRHILSQQIKLSSGQNRVIRVDTANSNNEQTESSTSTDAAAPLTSGKNSTQRDDAPRESTVNPGTDGKTTPQRSRKVPGMLLLTLGGGLAAGGLVTGSIALARGNSLETDYPNGVPSSKHAEKESVPHLALAADILLGVGIVSATVGTILLIRNKKSQPKVTVTPTVAPAFAGVEIGGRF